MARVLVVSGFYNRAPLLERTVSSVLAQTYKDFELLVFDDKSSDNTSQVLRELDSRYQDDRFKYIVHAENKGFVRGLKEAIESTDSEYIAIQGSGDVSLPERLSLQVEFLDANPTAAAVGGWYYNVQEGQGTRRLRSPDADDVGLSDLTKENVFSHGEVMIRRSAYESVGGYRTIFKFSQDRDLWMRFAKAGFSFGTIKEPVYERFVQFDGVSYVPSKLTQQACYSTAAERLAHLGTAEEAAAVRLIERAGVEAYVSPCDSRVQAKLWKAAVRMIVFGSPEGGKQIAVRYISKRHHRIPLLVLSRMYLSPMRRVTHYMMSKAVGLQPVR